METIKRIRKEIRPAHILPIGYLMVILIGTFLLMLPIASRTTPLPFLDALFTATSASCVTGLIVVDTGTYFTLFGQVVVIALIQVGGLGFMTLTTLFFVILGKRISLKERMTMAESLGESRLQGILQLALNAFKVTFIFESIGACLLAIRFIPMYGWLKGAWYAVFHSISAFCNAGFDLMGNYTSLTAFVGDPLVNFTICGLIIGGGLGFTVVLDLSAKKRFNPLRMHSKLVLTMTGIVLLISTLMFVGFEFANPATMASLSFPQKIMAAFFQAVTCRTAGFNTISQIDLTDASKVVSSLLMFMGGCPAGTAGGIKLTTVAVILLTFRALVQNREYPEAFKRSMPSDIVSKALSVLLVGIALMLTGSLIVSVAEQHTAVGQLGFLNQVFELASAMGTVGLSTGVTGAATVTTHLVLSTMMYMGRAGLLSVAFAIGGNGEKSVVKYPEADVMVG